jgi:3-hydroxyacyl-[acyl-carrier-protein] dehydratase
LIRALYTSSVQDNGNIVLQLSAKIHPLFEAHFPDKPILPGFALIDILAEVLHDKIVMIHKSKFIRNIFPNDILECEVSIKAKKRIIKVFRNKEKVSEVVYETK